jgi:hypothetical protein
MNCTACKEKIKTWEFDTLDAIEEINPITFRKGNFHLECYKLLLEESKEIKSKSVLYLNRFDEYISKDKALINI